MTSPKKKPGAATPGIDQKPAKETIMDHITNQAQETELTLSCPQWCLYDSPHKHGVHQNAAGYPIVDHESSDLSAAADIIDVHRVAVTLTRTDVFDDHGKHRGPTLISLSPNTFDGSAQLQREDAAALAESILFACAAAGVSA